MPLLTGNSSFSTTLLQWFDRHGRKNLPWQQNKTAYTVWISETMLQQTQVITVIPYYERFIAQFPTLEQLAGAELDDVLALWSGLGYYSRARNLHKTAQRVAETHKGVLPLQLDALTALPGIGRSTAGAILSLADNQRQPILDGNVKRVLTRVFCVEGYPAMAAVNHQLWAIAEALIPEQRCGDYNQALMDLGASVCARTNPQCGDCPLEVICQANQTQTTHRYPEKKPKKTLPEKTRLFLMMLDQHNHVYLEKFSGTGIWEGLWGFPQFDSQNEMYQWIGARQQSPRDLSFWPVFRHTFSHFHLYVQPVVVKVIHPAVDRPDSPYQWHALQNAMKLGIPMPIKKLLQELAMRQGVDGG
jgi:A/G-specific adenine glycosylase